MRYTGSYTWQQAFYYRFSMQANKDKGELDDAGEIDKICVVNLTKTKRCPHFKLSMTPEKSCRLDLARLTIDCSCLFLSFSAIYKAQHIVSGAHNYGGGPTSMGSGVHVTGSMELSRERVQSWFKFRKTKAKFEELNGVEILLHPL
ncbi:hypothetical protein KIN20_032437 [Parelaphostrongylus tenuis]|uniref:Uncharacterized protein n=1 Tax=Parelaphostrongylus tenuis TaxID=148309 RepID=A0AAD5WI12_PARTN|nr:hypothetical protein KIN20_032437 [Parelaphostrongylus tenuis]